MNTKKLRARGDKLFSAKKTTDSLMQSIALNFYPERANFTGGDVNGQEFANHLMSSYPVMVQRDLANQIGGMLRKGKWFNITLEGEDPREHRARRWLQEATDVQYKLMHKRSSLFARATKEGDKDFTSFGQCAISTEWIPGHGLLYRCWHLKDMAWAENSLGIIDEFHRNWSVEGNKLIQMFGKKALAEKTLKAISKDAFHMVNVRHVVMPSSEYEGEKKYAEPFVSMFIDVDHDHEIQSIGLHNPYYSVPRWQTASGSAYAHSPATIVGIADARLVQDMHRVLLDAGEMAVRPPMVAMREAIRGDVSLYAGGMTWVEQTYDGQKAQDAIRPMVTDKSGVPIGMEMVEKAQYLLSDVFYLNKLTLPMTQDMTAYEASQRVQEYIRTALPVFEPMEVEYNGALCDITFDILMRAGAFGSPSELPPSLQGREVGFQFESPVRDAEGLEKKVKFQEAMGLIAQGAQVDPGAAVNLDMNVAIVGAMRGAGIPEEWLRGEDQVMKDQEAMAQAALASPEIAA